MDIPIRGLEVRSLVTVFTAHKSSSALSLLTDDCVKMIRFIDHWRAVRSNLIGTSVCLMMSFHFEAENMFLFRRDILSRS